MQIDEIKKLANLARIDMDEKEMAEIAKDFESILAYVDQVREVTSLLPEKAEEKTGKYSKLINVMREDEETSSLGLCADSLVSEMPETENGYLKVKKIL